MGKTNAYETLIKESTFGGYIIAVPTNELKNQVYNELIEMGTVDVMKTPELEYINDKEIREETNRLRDIGAFSVRKEFLKKSLLNLEGKKKRTKKQYKIEEIEKDISNISNYLEQNEIVNQFKGHIVTTWARLYHLSWRVVHTHSLIIDEDILRECIKTRTYSLKKLENTCKCLKTHYNKELEEKLETIIKAPAKKIVSVKPFYKNAMDTKVIEKVEEECSLEPKSIYNIFDVLSVSAIYKFKDEQDVEYVHCLTCRQVPKMKTIVLSATLESEFYEKFFEERDIEYKEIPQSEYMGKVIQDCSYSYSRTCLNNNPQILDMIRNKHRGLPLITFKKFCNDNDYNFGAIEGLNGLKRKGYCNCGLTILKRYCL